MYDYIHVGCTYPFILFQTCMMMGVYVCTYSAMYDYMHAACTHPSMLFQT